MKKLIVAATEFEIAPLLASSFVQNVDILITGVGQMPTAYHTGVALAKKQYDWVINAGICGSFRRDWALGKVVNVVSEQMGDLGIEEADGSFKDMFDMGFIQKGQSPFDEDILRNPTAAEFDFLPKAKGLTINKVHGFEPSIQAIISKYDVEVESMEGAGFFYACLHHKIPFLQIRGISNYVEKRNRAAWNIPLAIQNLNDTLFHLLA
jgi:futalosine hydrolase